MGAGDHKHGIEVQSCRVYARCSETEEARGVGGGEEWGWSTRVEKRGRERLSEWERETGRVRGKEIFFGKREVSEWVSE